MRTTAVLNLKGGVAKTTTVVNMAAILARLHKKRVLVIDADSQANTTEFFGGVPAAACTLSDMLRRTDINNPIHSSNFRGIDLLGADDSLMDLDLSKVEGKQVDVACLKTKLEQLRGEYDYVFIDCPPAFNAASAAALLAADDVLIPIKVDAFSLRGMANLMRQIRNMQAINKGLKLAGLLPTMFNAKSDNVADALQQLRKTKLHIFSPIRRSDKADDMTFEQAPLIICSPRSGPCRDYKTLVLEYMRGGAING